VRLSLIGDNLINLQLHVFKLEPVFENTYFSFFSDFKKRDFLRCFEMTLKKT